MNWRRILAYITGAVDKELLLRNEFLVAENKILFIRNGRTRDWGTASPSLPPTLPGSATAPSSAASDWAAFSSSIAVVPGGPFEFLDGMGMASITSELRRREDSSGIRPRPNHTRRRTGSEW